MTDLASAQSLDELKGMYRRLVAIYHPDRGGSTLAMQKLNSEYQLLTEQLKKSEARILAADFSRIKVGTRLYVNTTKVEVLQVERDRFRVVALGRCRQAVFCRKTGLGLYNHRQKASYFPIKRQNKSRG